jgi:hypothetical protein
VTACPNIEALELCGYGMLEDVPPKPLSKLSTSLTHLRIESEHKKLAPVLATLCNLQHLHVEGNMSDLALLQLTVLTQLTYFYRDAWDKADFCQEVRPQQCRRHCHCAV